MEMDLGNRVLGMQFGKKTNNMVVSIWMVTYNHQDYIAKAIESVMMQETNFEYKLFIGEDCSTDKTREICDTLKKKYSEKIELISQNKNLGANKNAQQIFKACFESGAKYIAMCEGDDYWTDPLKLQKQVDFLESNQGYVLCFHEVSILKLNGDIVDDFITKVPENYETIETFARLGNYIHTPSVLFRNVIKEFPFEFECSPIGDFFLYLLLAEQGKLKFINEKMAIYRHGVGVFSSKTSVKIMVMLNKQFACILSYLKDENIKKIILERNLNIIDSLTDNFKNYSSSNNYIALNKKYKDLFKIIVKKIFKYKLTDL